MVRTEGTGETRTARDSLGAVEVPAARLWGAQTQRAVENFPISGQPLPNELIHAMGLLKWAAATARLPALQASAGVRSCARSDADSSIPTAARP